MDEITNGFINLPKILLSVEGEVNLHLKFRDNSTPNQFNQNYSLGMNWIIRVRFMSQLVIRSIHVSVDSIHRQNVRCPNSKLQFLCAQRCDELSVLDFLTQEPHELLL